MELIQCLFIYSFLYAVLPNLEIPILKKDVTAITTQISNASLHLFYVRYSLIEYFFQKNRYCSPEKPT